MERGYCFYWNGTRQEKTKVPVRTDFCETCFMRKRTPCIFIRDDRLTREVLIKKYEELVRNGTFKKTFKKLIER